MSSPSNRREFLTSAAGAAAAVAACPPVLRAIEPIERNGTPKFKFSLAAYSYRDLLTGSSPELSLADFVDDCAAMQLHGTELTSYYFPKKVTDEFLHALARQCFRLGLDVSGTAVGNDFAHSAGEKRDAEIAAVKQWIDHAATLGAPVIRIFAGTRKSGQSVDEAHELMVEGIETCCDYAGRRGVFLALENHGGPTATADGVLRFVRDVQSPWFGVNLDSGNFYGDNPYEQLEQIAPYALNVQVKVVTADAARKRKTPTDFARLAQILRAANYRGYIVLEYEEAGDPRQECPKYIAQLREAFA